MYSCYLKHTYTCLLATISFTNFELRVYGTLQIWKLANIKKEGERILE